MYVLGYLRLDAVLQPRHATRHFLGVNVDGLLVSLCSLSRNLSGCEVRETSSVAFARECQPFVARPLLNNIREAHRYLAATATDFQCGKRCDILPKHLVDEYKSYSRFIALDLDARRRATACIDTLARHLRAYLVTDFKQDALDFIHDGVVDDIVVSNCHFLRIFSRFKAFFFFGGIIYQLSNKNAADVIFGKNNHLRRLPQNRQAISSVISSPRLLASTIFVTNST